MGGYASPDTRNFMGGAAVASGTKATIIIGPFDLLRWPSRSVVLHNGGAVTLSGATVQVSNDPGGYEDSLGSSNPGRATPPPSMWIDYDTATFISVGSGEDRGTTLPGAYRWWRVVGTSNQQGTITVSGFGYGISIA